MNETFTLVVDSVFRFFFSFSSCGSFCVSQMEAIQPKGEKKIVNGNQKGTEWMRKKEKNAKKEGEEA